MIYPRYVLNPAKFSSFITVCDTGSAPRTKKATKYKIRCLYTCSIRYSDNLRNFSLVDSVEDELLDGVPHSLIFFSIHSIWDSYQSIWLTTWLSVSYLLKGSHNIPSPFCMLWGVSGSVPESCPYLRLLGVYLKFFWGAGARFTCLSSSSLSILGSCEKSYSYQSLYVWL